MEHDKNGISGFVEYVNVQKSSGQYPAPCVANIVETNLFFDIVNESKTLVDRGLRRVNAKTSRVATHCSILLQLSL